MPHNFQQGDRALFVYGEDLMEGIVQENRDQEIIIQFNGISLPSSMEAAQLQYVLPFDVAC